MKVLQINATFKNGGSTGRIAYDLMQIMECNGIESYAAYGIDCGIENDHAILLQSKNELRWGQLQSRLFARHGFYNISATKRLLAYMDKIKPDVVHLHNIHGFYVNCGMLFDYIKDHNIPVVWTLHDCWSFTGWCAYFDYSGCDKWKSHCINCPSKKDYPKAWISSRSNTNFDLKRKTFCGVNNLTLVTPSKWLAQLTRESFLRDYPVRVINNGVDVSVFKPTKTSIKKDLGIEGMKMILAVAGGFAKRKGSEYLMKIPSMLNKDEVLVILGINEHQKSSLPSERCIGIPYTNNVIDLASIYSAADVFINTTLEDNFPTTNIEALACGTPVITFNTGGSVEAVLDEEQVFADEKILRTRVGGVVPKGDVVSLLKLSREFLLSDKATLNVFCAEKVNKLYNKQKQYELYVDLYNRRIISNKEYTDDK